jgi:L-lactate dehydrogenase complex protein LldE
MRAMPPPSRIQLFITCLVDSLYPGVGESVVDVLERLGVTVEFPEAQTCCGQPGYNAGFREEARQLALNFLEVFEPHPLPPSPPPSPDVSAGEGGGVAQPVPLSEANGGSAGAGGEVPIVTPSGSCAAMLVHGYPDLLANDPQNLARAHALARRTYEFSQFLVEVLETEDVGASFGSAQDRPFGEKLTYHPSCHLLRGLGVKEAAPKLLARVRGVEVVPLPHADECCGFGGLFAVKHGDISAAMLDRKLENVRASGAGMVVGCDMSCLMHMQGALARDGSPIRCLHLAEALARQSSARRDS